MGIQTWDVGAQRDMFTVLSDLGTRLSDSFAARLADLLELAPPGGPPSDHPATQAEIAEFRAACERKLAVTNSGLDAELARTTLLDCLCLAVLFGQGENGVQLGAANVFAHEMEFLASCQPRISSPSLFTRDSVEAAMRALILARRHNVLDGQLALTRDWVDGETTAARSGERWQLHHQLAWSWRSEHGAFPTRYDWEYSLRLAQRIRDRGGDHPDLVALLLLHMYVLFSWFDVLRELQDTISDPALRTLLRERTLLHLPADLTLSAPTANMLALAGSRLLLPWSTLAETLAETQRQEATRWRALLTADPQSLGRNTARRHLFDSPLASTPLIEVEDRVLFSLPHVVNSDLSRLVERVFARLPNLAYYRARGEAVEETALHQLAGVFAGARVLRGGTYPGPRPGELIEVDGVLVWQDVALVLEGKGGYLGARSRHGDPEAAVADLRRTIGDGFFQVARLVRALDRDGHVTLTGEHGQSLTLERKAIRRIYAIVPTADTFDPLSTTLGLLWRREVLPDGAFPAILAVQHLHLLTDLLPTPLELLAYLEYQEEVLAVPQLRTGGELELVATFAATMDVVGTFREMDVPSGILGTDHQQTYLDPWLGDSFLGWLNRVPPVPPPRRHVQEHRAKIERFLTATRDTAAAIILHQLTGAQLGVAELYARRVPPLRRGTLSLQCVDELGIVVTNPLDSIDTMRAVPPVRELRARSRWVVYLTPGAGGAAFRHAERGGAHVFGCDSGLSLAEESRLGAVADWFDRAAARRRGAHRPVTTTDQANVHALRHAGATDTVALGLARLRLTKAVLDLADHDPKLGLTRAADFYLTHVRQAADALEVATADLALTTSAAHDVLRLVTGGRIRPEDAAALIEQVVREPTTPPEALARSAGMLTDQDDVRLVQAVQAALDSVDLAPEQIRFSRGKERRRIRDRLLGVIRRDHPDVNLRAAAERVERLWEPPE